MKKLLFFFISLNIFSSCKSTYGIKKVTKISTENIEMVSAIYGIKESYILDKKTYLLFLKSFSNDSLFIKNHTQPLQAIYFNQKGEMISYFINCNAGGFPNLVWNKANSLDAFPPKTQTKIDANFHVSELLKYLKMEESKTNQQYVFLFWNDYLGRQTKLFINEFRNNINKSTEKNVNIIYVNNDNLYVD